jgi:hypothetical protein
MPGAMKKSVAAGAGSGYDFALGGAQERHQGANGAQSEQHALSAL